MVTTPDWLIRLTYATVTRRVSQQSGNASMPVSDAIQIGRKSYSCSSCASAFRIDRFVPYTIESTCKYCPACGAETLALAEPQPVYSKWQEFAALAGLPDADYETTQLVQQLYDLWKPFDGDPPSFVQFIKEQMG